MSLLKHIISINVTSDFNSKRMKKKSPDGATVQEYKEIVKLRISPLLMRPYSLLICTLRSDFEGGRKVVLQTQICFWLETQIKVGLYYQPPFFLLEKSGSANSDFFSCWRLMAIRVVEFSNGVYEIRNIFA
jgi:hypothetical protein